MTNRQGRQRKPPNNGRRGRPVPPPLALDLTRMLPREWRRSPAWKHFRTAQVEFLTGMQMLMNDWLERLKMPEEGQRELRRIQVEK